MTTAPGNLAPALAIRDLRFRYGRRGPDGQWIIEIAALELGRGEQMLLRGGSRGAEDRQ